MKRACLVTTIPGSLYMFHTGRAPYFRDHGYTLTGIAGPGSDFHRRTREEMGISTYCCPSMLREISLWHDACALFWLWWHFLWHRYDVIHLGTPKAMLLGGIAARMAGHRNILSTHHGRVYENFTGRRRRFFMFLEKVTSRCMCYCIPVAKELGEALVSEGLCPERKIRFVPPGSCNGFDATRFQNTPEIQEQAKHLRSRLNIPEQATVLLFVGRIRFDKGIVELVDAFCQGQWPETYLLLVGDLENTSPLPEQTTRNIESNPRIIQHGFLSPVFPAYAAADVFILPSHREGFPLVPMEAACFGLPTIGSDINGTREAILDGKTGLLFPLQDTDALREAIDRLVTNEELRSHLGKNGYRRVVTEFLPERIWAGILEIYDALTHADPPKSSSSGESPPPEPPTPPKCENVSPS